MEEIWEDLGGIFGKHYQVSSHGRVRSKNREITRKDKRVLRLRSKILSQVHHSTNCYRVRLCVDSVKYSKSVHRLVAEAFLPNLENKPEVNHKDGDRLNNNLSNLEWCTKEENMRHAVETGLIYNPFGEYARNSKYITRIYKDGVLVAETKGNAELKDLGFDYRNVHACLTGRQKSHRGHTFKRVPK